MTEMNESLNDPPDELEVVFQQLRHRYGDKTRPPAGPALVSLFEAVPAGEDNLAVPMSTTAKIDDLSRHVHELPDQISLVARGQRHGARLLTATTTLIGTTVGKLVLGATVVAASVGTGQAIGVFDIPGLPRLDPALKIETVDMIGDVDEGDVDEGDVGDRDVGRFGDSDGDDDETPVGDVDDDENPAGDGDDDQNPVGDVDEDGNPVGDGDGDGDDGNPVGNGDDGDDGDDDGDSGDDDDSDGDGEESQTGDVAD